MVALTFRLADAQATEQLGAALADLVQVGDVIALSGGLGMGKTSLARGLIRALGHQGEVPSPSFAIVQPYYPPDVRLTVLHCDFYRLESASDLVEVGLDDEAAEGVMLAEWPENVGGLAGDHVLALTLAVPDDMGSCAPDTHAGRIATLTPGAHWNDRLPCLTFPPSI